mgnify:CR=1 FL=1
MTLGHYLQTLRRQSGLTQGQVAQAIGLSGNSLISRIESGQTTPSTKVINELARLFDQDVEALTARSTQRNDGHAVIHAELDAMAREADLARAQLSTTVTKMLDDFDAHRETLGNFLVGSKLNLVWALPRKLKRERQAQTVWILSPELESETCVPGVRATVANNLARGATYRYLIPNRPEVVHRARDLLTQLGEHSIEFRLGSDALFDFAVETVIYDAETESRLSLMVAPTRRSEFDIVLGTNTADRFEASFSKQWLAHPILK